jgi:hypothetical protein
LAHAGRINFAKGQYSIFHSIGWPLPKKLLFAVMAPTNHAEAMSVLLQSPKFSDLILACPDQEFQVHRAIVCPHSAFFSNACTGAFKAGYQSHFPWFAFHSYG